MSIVEGPDNCECYCFETLKPANKRAKGGKKIPFIRYKSRIKVNPQARYNICAHSMPITSLAQSFDKVLQNRILVPANKLTKKVNLSLKNKTFRQIIISSGLTLKVSSRYLLLVEWYCSPCLE
jgi:hypothetical protein